MIDVWYGFGVAWADVAKNAVNGPAAIRAALRNLYSYSIYSGCEMDCFFHGEDTRPKSFAAMTNQVGKKVQEILAEGNKPIVFGGEHAITYGVLKALRKKFGALNVVQFDAHLDMNDRDPDLSEKGITEKYSRATFMRRALEDGLLKRVVCIGTRDCSAEEEKFAGARGIRWFTPQSIQNSMRDVAKELAGLNGPIYVTIDMDSLDPSIVPDVPVPVAAGLDVQTVLRLLQKAKNPVGFDIMLIGTKRADSPTAAAAAYILREYLCALTKKK